MASTRAYILILSGGSGVRFDSILPKQFTLFRGKEIILHSLERFFNWKKTEHITIATRTEDLELTKSLVEKTSKKYLASSKSKTIQIIEGAINRHLSCLNGLEQIFKIAKAEDVIFIHDAVRPMLEEYELEALWQELLMSKNKIVSLASPLYDTIVKAKGWYSPIDFVCDRTSLYAVKTPQAAYVKTLLQMIEQPSTKNNFTDLLMWGDACGIKASLVRASHLNQKITVKGDIERLEFLE